MHLGLVFGWGVKNWASAKSKTEALVASGSPGWAPPTHFAHFFPLLCMHPDGLVVIWGQYMRWCGEVKELS